MCETRFSNYFDLQKYNFYFDWRNKFFQKTTPQQDLRQAENELNKTGN